MVQPESHGFATNIVFLVACAALCSAGCASSGRTLGADPETWASSISIGDHLRVTTTSGNETDIYVAAVSESGISDNKGLIPYSDIQSIRLLPSKSGSSDSAVPLIAVTILVVAALASLVASEVDKGFVQPAQ